MNNANFDLALESHRVFVFVETHWKSMEPGRMAVYLLGINAAIPELYNDLDFLVDICHMKEYMDNQLELDFDPFHREAVYTVDSGRVQP